MFSAMSDELVKIARVPKAVKMYRRATEALRGGHSFHGTKNKHVKEIAEAGQLDPFMGTHGKGVYTWRGRPRSTYMRYPDYPGVIAPRKALKMGKTPPDPRAGSDLAPGLVSERSFMDISETPVKLPPKTMLSAPPAELVAAREGMKKNRLRPIDSAIFHRAEADTAMRRIDPLSEVEPTKKELMDLFKRKKEPKRVGMTRGRRTEAETESFHDMYEAATS